MGFKEGAFRVERQPSDGWALRRLRFAMLPEVAAIEQEVFPEPLALRDLERLWRSPDVRYVAYLDGERVAAYFGFEVHGPVAHVICNATHPDYRRLGLGGRILREAEPLARAMGARLFLGEVRRSNEAQRRVLQRIGWREVGECRGFFGNGEDAYIVLCCF